MSTPTLIKAGLDSNNAVIVGQHVHATAADVAAACALANSGAQGAMSAADKNKLDGGFDALGAASAAQAAAASDATTKANDALTAAEAFTTNNAALRANNLLDLTDKAAARANLGGTILAYGTAFMNSGAVTVSVPELLGAVNANVQLTPLFGVTRPVYATPGLGSLLISGDMGDSGNVMWALIAAGSAD